jgi:(p)ppGpp synthase/HD superfamily hydrolase
MTTTADYQHDDGEITVRGATVLAAHAHGAQVDKAGRPYMEHLERVRDSLAPHGDVAMITGVLHDVLEDTAVTAADLSREGVPDFAVEAIRAVTRREGETYMELIRRAAAHPLGRLVKLADNADNADEGRLALLDAGRAASLRKRYARARQVLLAAAEDGSPS